MKNKELSILNVNISCFENCKSAISKETRLLSWLTNDKYRARVEQLRAIQDEDLQKIIKASLPAITPSGLFSYRDTEHLIEHSGFLVFDIDRKENRNISFDGLREQISHIPSVAYCGLSVRGQGLWGLVPIPKSTPDEHKQRFSALAKDFKTFDINLDPSGSDVCRLRIYSWDPDAYFNHDAKLYTKLIKPQAKKSTRPALSDTRERVEAIISQIKENKIDITQSYDEWLKVGYSLSNEFGENGRDYFHAISQYHLEYSIQGTDNMFDNVLKNNKGKSNIGLFFKIAADYGIKLKLGGLSTIDKGPEHNTRNEIANQYESAEVSKKDLSKTLPDIGISRKEVTTLSKVEKIVKPGIWSNEITELEQFFASVKLPTNPIRLDKCSTITDPSLFIDSHLSIVKAQNGNLRYKPYMDRLIELKAILKSNMN